MANGSHKEGPARADRFREEAEKYERLIQRDFDALPGSQPYREEMDSVTDAQIGKDGVRLKGLPPWAIVCLAVLGALVVAFLGWLRYQH